LDIHKRLKRLIGQYRVWCSAVHIIQNRLVIDVGWWDGLGVRGHLIKDKIQKTEGLQQPIFHKNALILF